LVGLLCYKVLFKYIVINGLFMVTVGGGFIFLFIPYPHACFSHQLGCFPATHWKAQRIQYFLNASFSIGIIAELGDILYPFQINKTPIIVSNPKK
jgi:hypothetical protein